MRTRTFIVPLGLALWFVVATAQADLTFVLTPAAESAAISNEVFFVGVLSNTSLTSNLFLNDIQFSFTGAATNYLAADTNSFFANVPGILLPGETYSDIVFGVTISPATLGATISARSPSWAARTFLRPPIWQARCFKSRRLPSAFRQASLMRISSAPYPARLRSRGSGARTLI